MYSSAELTMPAHWTATTSASAGARPLKTPPTGALPTQEPPTQEPPTQELSTEALESELVGLAGHLAAGHCRWLGMLAEFDNRQGWAGPGLRSCAHWLSWRVGMGLRAGYEQLRVAHALSALPAVTEAFGAGRISYSKVRAITRVATPATEGTLLDVALAGTASHVERVVRHTRQASADPVASARRELSWRWDDDGTLVLHGRFTSEQGARLVTAINTLGRTSAADGNRTQISQVCSAEHSDSCTSLPVGTRRADALIALVGGDRQVDPQLVVVIDADADVDPDATAGTGSARIQGGPAIAMRTAERVGCNARVRALLRDRRGNPLHLGRARRLASPVQLAALHIRDQGRCQFPGCDHTRHLQAHHIVHWLRGGRTDIDNLVLICGHHHNLIHDHGYRARGRGTEVTFHRPGGRPIEPVGPPTSGNVDELIAEHTAGRIDGDTLTPTWAGERLDLSGILAELLPEDAWPAVA